jgi:hypothetical protein
MQESNSNVSIEKFQRKVLEGLKPKGLECGDLGGKYKLGGLSMLISLRNGDRVCSQGPGRMLFPAHLSEGLGSVGSIGATRHTLWRLNVSPKG